jgi:hypothetical protein
MNGTGLAQFEVAGFGIQSVVADDGGELLRGLAQRAIRFADSQFGRLLLGDIGMDAEHAARGRAARPRPENQLNQRA